VSTKKIVDTSRITPHQVKRGDRDAYVADGTVQLSGTSIEGDFDWIGAGIKKLGCANKDSWALLINL
jgi:hypothetical protein